MEWYTSKVCMYLSIHSVLSLSSLLAILAHLPSHLFPPPHPPPLLSPPLPSSPPPPLPSPPLPSSTPPPLPSPPLSPYSLDGWYLAECNGLVLCCRGDEGEHAVLLPRLPLVGCTLQQVCHLLQVSLREVDMEVLEQEGGVPGGGAYISKLHQFETIT